MSSVFGGGYEELAVQAGRPAAEAKAAGAPDEHVANLAALNRIERELRRIRSFTNDYGRQYADADGGQCGANTFFVQRFEGPKSGNDWYVERVAVSVSGASAAGTVVLYRSSSLGAAGVLQDESQFVDYLGALAGSSPSRGVLDGRGTPYFVYGGNGLTVVVANVVAGASVFITLQGREVLAGADPALRQQADY